jgi:hypothetical protein
MDTKLSLFSYCNFSTINTGNLPNTNNSQSIDISTDTLNYAPDDGDTMHIMFDDAPLIKKKIKKKKKKNNNSKNTTKSLYITNNKKTVYNERTMEYYRVIRSLCYDPITYIKLSKKTRFKIPYMWDPYTGERLGLDPYGPLYISPDNLIHYFYTMRLKKLWIKPADEQSGFYQGTFDDAVGIGNNFYLKGRGYFPEWYIFRLPIVDCYLNKDYMMQAITLTPKITIDDVKEIDRLANLNKLSYYKQFKKKRPLLKLIWNLYHDAINKNPVIKKSNTMTKDELNIAKIHFNMKAVRLLQDM